MRLLPSGRYADLTDNYHFWIEMLPSPYIPGIPGMQLKHLTSEHASLWDRMMEEYSALRLTISMVPYILERRKQRAAAGLRPTGRPPAKPDYLVFVNSFFGLEVPKDLPPLVRVIGPVMSDDYPGLDAESPLASFLTSHRRVLYISFGTHFETPEWRKRRMIEGIQRAMKEGDIDGVIWAMKVVKRPGSEDAPVDPSSLEADSASDGKLVLLDHPQDANQTNADIALENVLDYRRILAGRNPAWLMVKWIPQRAILSHPSTALYLAHCGASSTMEAAYHGVPVIAMPLCADQIGNGRRLEAAGVAVFLDKHTFSAKDLATGIAAVTRDADGSYARNVLRLRRLAHVNSSRKEVAASLIEETIYDRELAGPVGDEGVGRQRRPFHLQTCDTRMSWIKRTNWDVRLLFPFCLPLLTIYSWIRKT